MPQFIGTVYLDVRADTSRVGGDLSRTMGGVGAAAGASAGDAMASSLSDRLLKFGTQATRVGRQLSIGLSAPLIGLGVASEKAFLAYDTNMTKVAALTGTGTQQTAAWSGEVLDLATQFGVAGEDAANALYLITSSGIKGQAAIDTLKVALGGAAIGMGDAATVAGLLTSAMNAYGEANLPAAKAADILTGAIQESKIPADQLAGSISNLLPFGKQLGVGFDQITGAMAALSLQGTGAAQAATQLRGIFNGLLDPSAQAAKALTKIGLSAADLRQTLSSQGIVPALRQIRDAIIAHGGDTDEELAQVFGNVRALTGAFGLLNDEGGKVDRIFANTANSAGKFNAALAITQDSAGFKARQAVEGLHNEMTKLGESVAPVGAAMLTAARFGVELINALGPAKYVLVGVGAAFAILGPLAFTVGAMADAVGILAGVMGAATATSSTLALAQSGLAAAEAAVAAAELAVIDATAAEAAALLGGSAAAGEAAAAAVVTAAASADLAAAQQAAAVAAAELAAAETAASGAAATFGAIAAAAFVPVAAAVVAIGGAFLLWKIRMDQAQESANRLGDAFANAVATKNLDQAAVTIEKTKVQIAGLNEEIDNSHAPWDADYRDELRRGKEALEAHVKAAEDDMRVSRELAAQSNVNADALFGWLTAERAAGRFYANNAAALAAYRAAVNAQTGATGAATTSTNALNDATSKLATQFFGVQSAQRAYDDAVNKVADAQRNAEDATRKVADARRAEVDAIAKVADAQQHYRDSLDKVTDAQKKLTDAQAALNEEMRGPTVDEALDLRQAKLALRRAQAGARKTGQDPLEREQSRIDLARARGAVDEAQGAHAKNLAKAQDDVTSAQKGLTDAQREALDAAKAITDAQRGVEDAHRNVGQAERDAVKAQQEIQRAQEDAVGAAENLTKKHTELAGALSASKGAAGELVGYLEALKGQYPDAAAGIDVYLASAKALRDFYEQPGAPQTAEGAGFSLRPEDIPQNASGGPLSSGQLSTVNERNLPELWSQGGKQYLLPLRAGNVVPISPVDLPVKGGENGLSMGDINVYEVSGKPRQTAYEVRREMRKESFLAGKRS